MSDTINEVERFVSSFRLNKESIIAKSNELLSSWGLEGDTLIYVRTLLLLLCAVVLGVIVWFLFKRVLFGLVKKLILRTKSKWDDSLLQYKFFSGIANLAPLFLLGNWSAIVFYSFPKFEAFFERGLELLIVYAVMILILRFFDASRAILKEEPKYADKPIDSYFQLGKMVVIGIFSIVIISLLFGVSIRNIFISLGATSAVLLLIFQNSIIGFVSSIRLAPNEHGVAIQIYAFTNTKVWTEYEEVMADVFDHLIAAASYFDLEVFESPSNADVRELKDNPTN